MADTGFTGVDGLNYIKRLLAMENISQDRWKNPAIYDFLTEGRDMVLQALSLSAPTVVRSLVPLVNNPVGSDFYELDTDPYKVMVWRYVTTGMELVPSMSLNRDTGDYEVVNLRTIRLAEGLTPTGGLEAWIVPHVAALTKATTASGWGIPQTCHRLACKGAALIMLGTDEELNPSNMTGLFQRELVLIENIYSEFDGQAGMGMREAFMSAYGEWQSDSIY